jgi:hypothetical protein
LHTLTYIGRPVNLRLDKIISALSKEIMSSRRPGLFTFVHELAFGNTFSGSIFFKSDTGRGYALCLAGERFSLYFKSF